MGVGYYWYVVVCVFGDGVWICLGVWVFLVCYFVGMLYLCCIVLGGVFGC